MQLNTCSVGQTGTEMRAKSSRIIAAIAIFSAGCMAANESQLTTVTNHPIYRAGQVWRYANRPGEDGSTFTVLQVDREPKLGIIVHIRVSGVRFKGAPEPSEIGHMPFSESAIAKSMPVRVAEETPPSLPDGYRLWRQAFESGKGGIFTVSIADGVSFVEKTLPDQRKN